MAKQNTISSTEKLLELIRRKKPPESPPVVAEQPSEPGGPDIRSRVGGLLTMRRKATIGVSLGYTDVKLVKISQASGPSQELLDYRSVAYPPEITPQHPNFPSFLRRVLLPGPRFPRAEHDRRRS